MHCFLLSSANLLDCPLRRKISDHRNLSTGFVVETLRLQITAFLSILATVSSCHYSAAVLLSYCSGPPIFWGLNVKTSGACDWNANGLLSLFSSKSERLQSINSLCNIGTTISWTSPRCEMHLSDGEQGGSWGRASLAWLPTRAQPLCTQDRWTWAATHQPAPRRLGNLLLALTLLFREATQRHVVGSESP